MRGTRTLTEYSSHECEQSHVQSLRDCKLSDTEIQLWLLYGDNEGVSDVIDIWCNTSVIDLIGWLFPVCHDLVGALLLFKWGKFCRLLG